MSTPKENEVRTFTDVANATEKGGKFNLRHFCRVGVFKDRGGTLLQTG